ncbi:hypothetical protein DCAR_0310895 [Daucus carota subsp. sativus]|uniref:BRCA2 OB1 domain-containing protein n=1 Tax=Daucus carota subsp. sativus TaxID=79200 RepID=A0A161XWH9_DAUCS|nr:hypothetical protein DCAR_0310895 [Daucus carota subsp. sativus]
MAIVMKQLDGPDEAIQTNTEAMTENISNSHGVDKSTVANVELTDRWSAVNAVLDAPLSKKLASGILFVRQKHKDYVAGLAQFHISREYTKDLRGWKLICSSYITKGADVAEGVMSELQKVPSTVNMVLRINGTCRSPWAADRLGFYKHYLGYTCNFFSQSSNALNELCKIRWIYSVRLQKLELVEGHAYAVSGIVAFSYGSGHNCPGQACFKPRKPVLLYIFDEVPLSSEFDIAGLVVLMARGVGNC